MDNAQETIAQRAVHRCCDEIGRSILYLKASRAIEQGETWHGIDFIRLALLAFEDQMVAHAIKVLMQKEEAGFWYLYNQHKADCQRFCEERRYDVDVDIAALVPKLKHVRDKTHFHLDRIGVRDPKAIWAQADIAEERFERALMVSYAILDFLHEKIRGSKFPMPDYDGSDAAAAAKFVECLH
jgi:hypothetical protein